MTVNKLNRGHTVNPWMEEKVDEVEGLILPEYNHGEKPYLIKHKDWVLATLFQNKLKQIPTFEIRDDDIWILSYPKSGVTWTQEIVYLIMNDADIEKASSAPLNERFPFFELAPDLETISRRPSPRLIKSHLPFPLLPNQIEDKKPKILYVMRNPKDVVNSYYSFVTKFLTSVPFNGSYEDFCQLFAQDKVLYAPWWKHISEAWKRKDDDNVLFLIYEDLQLDLEKHVKIIAEFLHKPLTDEQIKSIVRHCSFENMKDNPSVNYQWLQNAGGANKDVPFMRKGKVGDWKNHLSKDIVRQLDEMVATKIPHDIPVKDSLPEASVGTHL